MNLRRIRHKLRKSLAQRGAIGTAKTLVRSALRPATHPEVAPKVYEAAHPFDREFGVETSGLLFAEDLASGQRDDLYNAGYFGVAPSALRQILQRLAVDFEKYTFFDLGSGKGRALLVASEYPFHAIAGVELSPKLHAIAKANIAAYRGTAQRCTNVQAIEGDATQVAFPAGHLIVYLWNPFEAPVFRRVLARLEAELEKEPRDIYIVYIQPDLEMLLAGSKCWRKVWGDDFVMSAEDYAAYAFPSQVETCVVYRAVVRSGPYPKVG